MKSLFYVLKDKLAVPCEDLTEWSLAMQYDQNRVAQTVIADGIWVSTVFLGIDHNYVEGQEPLLFETMAFQVEGSQLVEQIEFSSRRERDSFFGSARRDSNWGDAERSHKLVCDELRQRMEAAKDKASNLIYSAVAMEQ